MIFAQALFAAGAIALLLLFLRLLYRISPAHPLAHIPGPVLPRTTSLWLVYHAWIGDECTAVHKLHQRYGPVVRTGPISVDIADGEALQAIYVEKGGFGKAAFYRNFDIDGHASIFSELDSTPRALRAKAVASLFSSASLRQGQSSIDACVNQWVELMRAGARSGRPVNVLDLARSLAVDVVSSYLFGRSYGGLKQKVSEESAERTDELSASGMVNSFVAVGRYWYLPPSAFNWLAWAESKLYPDWKVFESINVVDEFVEEVVDASLLEKTRPTTYHGKLLEAGFSVSEVKAQCKDLMFAGTDSTGMNLATVLFMLAKHPEKYEQLRAEFDEAPEGLGDIQALPYLRAVIKEGLRISMANPSRLPRVVPPSGWSFQGMFFPEGAEVSCTPSELHFGDAFDDPNEFRPERWLSPTDEMLRDAIPWGLGTRSCIARNLATLELHCAVYHLVKEDVLRGASCCQDKIEILEWFNSRVIDEKIELSWA